MAALSAIVTALCARVGLTEADIDVVDLEEIEVDGYSIASMTNGRQGLEPLRTIGLFDYFESDGRLVFRRRGGPAVATLSEVDLGAALEGEAAGPSITTTKAQDVELPRQIRLRYPSADRDYEISEQLSPARVGTVGVNEITVDVPVVMTDEQAAKVVEIAFRDAWASRWRHQFTVDQSWHELEPADPVLVPIDERMYRLRITSIDDVSLMLRRIEAVRDDGDGYVSTATPAAPRRPQQVIRLLAQTEALFLDLPPLRDEDDNAGFYLATWPSGLGRTWPGASVYRSVDGGATWQPIGATTTRTVVGSVQAVPSGDGYTWSDSELEVEIESGGVLESRSDAAVLAGANAAAIGAPGRWHIVQFGEAELIAPNTYVLRRLLLGRRGTEHLISTVEPGDRFVLLSGLIRLPLQISEIGAERLYRVVTSGTPLEAVAAEPFAGAATALECFAPVQVRGERDGSDNLQITWLRRDRLSQTLRDGVLLPMSESVEEYEVDVLDGETVVRTIEVTTTSAEYTAADQVTDFGSAQSSVTVRIYQLSATVGRGAYAEATI